MCRSFEAELGRHHRTEGFAPPRRVLLELCRQLPGYRVENDAVVADPPSDWRAVLGNVEGTMVRIMLKHGPVMQREKFEQLCVSSGIKTSTFYIYLDYSPLLVRHARGVYGLRGAPVPPGLVEDLKPAIRRSERLVDYGWTAEGTIWIGYRLSKTTIASGVIAVPAAMRRFVQGDFVLRTEDGSNIGKFTVRENGSWGLTSLFRRRGGESGDILLLVIDLASRQATASIGDESLLLRAGHIALSSTQQNLRETDAPPPR